MSTIAQDVAEIVKEQAAGLAAIGNILPDINKDFTAVISAIATASVADQTGQKELQASLIGLANLLGSMARVQKAMALDLLRIRLKVVGVFADDVEGIDVLKGLIPMAQKAKCTVVKAKVAAKAPRVASISAPAATPGVFTLLDAATGTFTTMGTDAVPGDLVDISALATETVTSDNPALTMGAVAGMAVTFTAPATGSGSSNIVWTVTFNDGSVGPFTFSGVISWSGGAITGIVVNQS